MNRTLVVVGYWVLALLGCAGLAAFGAVEEATWAVALVWLGGLLGVVWLVLAGTPDPVTMPPRRLPVVPPLSQPDPVTRDLERLLTGRFGAGPQAAELAAALSRAVARVPAERRGGLPSGLRRFLAQPTRMPTPGVLNRWLAALEEASDAH